MTEEQKKKRSGREIGSISQQWATFGSEENGDNQPSEKTDSQISSNLDSQMMHYSESQKAGLPKSQIVEDQDKKMVSYLRKKKPERKAQIAYLPLELIKWLKVQSAQEDREMSEIVEDALKLYRDRKG